MILNQIRKQFCSLVKVQQFEHQSSLEISKITLDKESIQQKNQIQIVKDRSNVFLDINKISQKHRLFQTFNINDYLKILDNENHYKLQHLSKFVLFHSMMRKFKVTKVYENPIIMNSIYFVAQNLDKLQQEHVSGFAINLYNMKIYDEQLYQYVLVYYCQNIQNLTLFSIGNILFSISKFPKTDRLEIYSLFRNSEVPIAIKFKEHGFCTKSFSQIAQSYFRVKNSSKEFQQFLQIQFYDNFDSFTINEITNLCYSFKVNRILNQDLQEKLSKNNLQKEIYLLTSKAKFNIREISQTAYALKDSLDEELFKILEQQFLLKSDQANVQDLSLIIEVFFQHSFVNQSFYEKITNLMMHLRGNIDLISFLKMNTNISDLANKKLVQNKYIHLLSDTLKRIKNELSDQQKLKLRNQYKKIENLQNKDLFLNQLN